MKFETFRDNFANPRDSGLFFFSNIAVHLHFTNRHGQVGFVFLCLIFAFQLNSVKALFFASFICRLRLLFGLSAFKQLHHVISLTLHSVSLAYYYLLVRFRFRLPAHFGVSTCPFCYVLGCPSRRTSDKCKPDQVQFLERAAVRRAIPSHRKYLEESLVRLHIGFGRLRFDILVGSAELVASDDFPCSRGSLRNLSACSPSVESMVSQNGSPSSKPG